MSASLTDPVPGLAVDVVALGGLREFGMNMLAVRCGETVILVDAGVMFPGPELPGVDLIIPDLTFLETLPARPAALFLTHGHEDHVGAVPYVLRHVDGPVYATPFTLALVEPKLEEHGIPTHDRLRVARAGERVTVGPLSVEFIPVTHSMPACMALAIHTPAGTIVHTGDFKIDQTPLDGRPFDLHRFAELGREGVLALFSDSTNVDRPGFTGSELEVIPGFEEIFASTTGRIVVATFASSIYRMQILVDLAARFGRKLAFVGRGVIQNSEIARRLGHLSVPDGLVVRDAEVSALPPERVVCLCTGSQGEPLAALSRIAIDDHRHVSVAAGDTVVFSARAIPGNEKAIGRVMNHLARRHADVVHEGIRHVHVSGHGSAEELKLVLSLVKPRVFVPIHGEFRQLAAHARIAARIGGGATDVLAADNGEVIRFEGGEARVVDRVTTGRILIDGTRTGEVDDEVLRDRRHLSSGGLVVPVLAINSQSGALEGAPEVITRGFVVDDRTARILARAPAMINAILAQAGPEERTDAGLITERIRTELRRALRKASGRRPLVLPVVMEI